MQTGLILEVLLALALGALVGIERERRAKGELFAGIRTFMLVSLFGYLSAFLSDHFSSLFFLYAALVCVSTLSLLSYFLKYKKFKSVGLTTEFAFILTFILGVLIFYDTFPYFLPITLAVVITLILFSKEASHAFAKKIKKQELLNGLIFAILAFVILPILPNEFIDPLKLINPFLLWLSLVLVLSISFAAYVAFKILGKERGLIFTSLFGGLISSTMLTFSIAKQKFSENSIIFVSLLSNFSMFLRILIFIAILNFWFLKEAILPLGLLMLLALLLSLPFLKNVKWTREKIEIKSPLAFKQALFFMLLFTLIFALVKFFQTNYGTAYLYFISFLSGFATLDAIVIALLSLKLPSVFIIKAILLASFTNLIFKITIFWIWKPKVVKRLIGYSIPLLLFNLLLILA